MMADIKLFVVIGELDMQEFMCSDEKTEWMCNRLARAFASMSHLYVLKFWSAVPAEGSARGGAAARKWDTQHTFDVDTEIQRRSQTGRVIAIISDNSNKNRTYGGCSGTPGQLMGTIH